MHFLEETLRRAAALYAEVPDGVQRHEAAQCVEHAKRHVITKFKEGKESELVSAFVALAPLIRDPSNGLQGEFLLKLPDGLMAQLFRAARAIEEKQALADLIPNKKDLGDLIAERWRSGKLEDASILYGSAYMNDHVHGGVLAGLREGAMEETPRDLLFAMLNRSWDARYKGILSWIKGEITQGE